MEEGAEDRFLFKILDGCIHTDDEQGQEGQVFGIVEGMGKNPRTQEKQDTPQHAIFPVAESVFAEEIEKDDAGIEQQKRDEMPHEIDDSCVGISATDDGCAEAKLYGEHQHFHGWTVVFLRIGEEGFIPLGNVLEVDDADVPLYDIVPGQTVIIE
jgi:hypothetical protein